MELEVRREMLTVAEAAQELGLTVRGVQERLLRGVMRGERLTPRMWVIPRTEVETWKERGRLKPGRPRRADRGEPEVMSEECG
ncbi:MAG: helix-turn-helix domain-containing protein [Dehalococcoidia bacterium]